MTDRAIREQTVIAGCAGGWPLLRWMLLSLLAVTAAGCHRLTEIVLVVDTDLDIPADVERFVITVDGTTMQAHSELPVTLTAPGALPATLGLLPATEGGATPMTVTVTAFAQDGSPVLTHKARTQFVPGESRMLRMVLSVACLPVTCDAEQSCEDGACVSVDQPGVSLAAWHGTVPPRPHRPPIVTVVGRSVWASGWHSAATEGTTLYAWGENSDGQLGSGNTQNGRIRRAVMKVQAPLSVGLGQKHSCICDGNHQAFCWGLNQDGELGMGTTTVQPLPTAVPGMDDCLQIAGGDLHTCAIRTGGTVSCWGKNAFGQTGQTAGASQLVPMQIPGVSDIVQVGGGDAYSCALSQAKTVLCWGNNNFGQLGDGTTVARATPAFVTGLDDVVEIAVGRFHSCARQSTGAVLCWGLNDEGQLGNGAMANSTTPVAVMGISDAAQIVAGHLHSCALSRTTGAVFCWGANNSGQLGVGMTPARSTVAIRVPTLFEVSSLAGGSEHSCARHNDTVVSCWGDNRVNQLGDGSTMTRRTPVTVAGF